MKNNAIKLGVVGLGYVGLPLAVAFAKKRDVVAYDISKERIDELLCGFDSTLEVDFKELASASNVIFTSDLDDLKKCNFIIISVPTPIDDYKNPNLEPLISASKFVGQVLKRGDIVVYESTVFPGCTEDICVPILESESNLKLNIDFYLGYSPERINPGDKSRGLSDIKKLIAGSIPEIANKINNLYLEIISAGTHVCSSIKIAESAKVIENIQRDVNIALMNEFSIIFNKLGLDTNQILKAAGTKWNFIPFSPGLVGGHCIGVDPYYLTYKAESIGYHPEIILAGRRINDGMSKYIATQFIKKMIKRNIEICSSRILIMGITFKENCPDIRNTKVVDLIMELEEFGCNVDVFDPWVDIKTAKGMKNINLISDVSNLKYSGVIYAVAHEAFLEYDPKMIRKFHGDKVLIFDIKNLFPEDLVDGRL